MSTYEGDGADVPESGGDNTAAPNRVPVDMSSARQIVVRRLSDEVAESIRAFIVDKGLAEGTRLPSERALAEQFGASRPTVSQALRTLSLMGLVETRRGSGAYVLRQPDLSIAASVNLMLELDGKSVARLAELRLWLETLGAREAAERIDDEAELLRARTALERLRASAGETSTWIAADTIFHATIVGLAGNPYLTSIYEGVHNALISFEYRPWVENDEVPHWLRPEEAAAQVALHEPIVAGIESRDPEATTRAVLHHHKAMLRHLGSRA
ncbi:MAG: GntR family transcriptional regulator, transcriptional repressor for pyruvate dehydrogenase complex [Pseudonocardiales bacterium]|jgi:GntR family transcriptional repressor for pyruvate dehydrogenase complex|nr:GntR family transcriptional regulator, transcriptional repressor for pyruvate dehydrogenase complex [Pseudonocardiales bacterium]